MAAPPGARSASGSPEITFRIWPGPPGPATPGRQPCPRQGCKFPPLRADWKFLPSTRNRGKSQEYETDSHVRWASRAPRADGVATCGAGRRDSVSIDPATITGAARRTRAQQHEAPCAADGILVATSGCRCRLVHAVRVRGRQPFEQGCARRAGRAHARRRLSEFAVGIGKAAVLLNDDGAQPPSREWLRLIAHESRTLADRDGTGVRPRRAEVREGMAEWVPSRRSTPGLERWPHGARWPRGDPKSRGSWPAVDLETLANPAASRCPPQEGSLPPTAGVPDAGT